MKPENNKGKPRLVFIDLLESMAMFAVIFYHSSFYDFNFLQESRSLFYIRYYIRAFCLFCIPSFFLVNGFLLLNHPFDLKKHVQKIIRVVILTVIWNIITVILIMLIKQEYLSPVDFLLRLRRRENGWNTHLWYMHELVVVYLLFPLIKIAYDTRRDIFTFFIITMVVFTFGNTLLSFLATMAAHLFLGENTVYDINWFLDFNPVRNANGVYYVYFCLGGVIMDIGERFRPLRKTWVCILGILGSTAGLFATGVTLSYISNTIWTTYGHAYEAVFTVTLVISVFSLCRKFNTENERLKKILAAISVNTMGIYFVHILYIQFFWPYVREMAAMNSVSGTLVYTGFIFILSLGTVLGMKKIPVLKKLV